MNKVATINLNGRAYQVEETGYDALRKYLDQAAEKLRDDPDKAEILADFEQAVADKCDARLSPRKNVVTAAEIDEVIKAMGPVEAGTGGEPSKTENADHGSTAAAPKRLYRIYEGAMFPRSLRGNRRVFQHGRNARPCALRTSHHPHRRRLDHCLHRYDIRNADRPHRGRCGTSSRRTAVHGTGLHRPRESGIRKACR